LLEQRQGATILDWLGERRKAPAMDVVLLVMPERGFGEQNVSKRAIAITIRQYNTSQFGNFLNGYGDGTALNL
jgi:hypothetical protein